MIHVAAASVVHSYDISAYSTLESISLDRFESVFSASSTGIAANEFKVGVKYVWNREWGLPSFYTYIKGETHNDYVDYEVLID